MKDNLYRIIPVNEASTEQPRETADETKAWREDILFADDFTSARWFGETHFFTDQQALVIKELWQAYQSGLPDRHQSDLLRAAGSFSAKLGDLFRHHKTWQRIIYPSREFGGNAGYYRLAPPPEKRQGTQTNPQQVPA